MNILSRATNSIKSAAISSLREMVFSGNGGQSYGPGGFMRSLFGSENIDYAKQIQKLGGLDETSIASICLEWRASKFIEAPAMVQKLNTEGEWQPAPNHELQRLLNNPNPGMSPRRQWMATDLSLGLDGNAYWIKVRSPAGKSVRAWWVGHWTMTPCWPTDGSQHISHYVYSVNGRHYLLPAADVIHFRNGVDMQNWRIGKAPLRPHLKHICTDEEGSAYSESVMRNCGVMGVLFVPKEAKQIPDGIAKAIKRRFKESTTKGNQGDSVILETPMEVIFPDTSPEKMALDAIIDTPEERIPAALKLNPMAVGLGAGLKRSTFNNMQEAQRSAWDNGVAPMHLLASDELHLQLVGEFDDPATTRVWFDYANVTCLQEDEDALHKRAREDMREGLLQQNEARAMIRKKALPTGDRDIFQIKVDTAKAIRVSQETTKPTDPAKTEDSES